MSLRYNRQYRIDTDIDGPVGPGFDNERISYIDDNLYLGGGGRGTPFVPLIDPILSPLDPVPTPINPTPNQLLQPADELINYEIAISSNLQNEVGDKIKLKYEIRSADNVVDSDSILLSDFNTDNKSLPKSTLINGILNIFLENTLPVNYNITKIYHATRQVAINNPTDYSKWQLCDSFIGMQSSVLLGGGVAVAVILEKVIAASKPIVILESDTYTKQIKDSDSDVIIDIRFSQIDSDFVDFYLSADRKIRVDSNEGYISLSFKNDFSGVYGSKKIIVVPVSDLYGTGDKVETIINFVSVNDFPSITEITYTDSIDVPAFSDLSIEYDVSYTTFSTSHVDVELLLKDNTKVFLFKKLIPNGSFKINLKELAKLFPKWNGSKSVTLTLIPSNNSGSNKLEGNPYEIKTNILYPAIQLDEEIIKKSLFDAFVESIKFSEPEKESKYLTHLANFGNDEQILISSWEEDNFTLSNTELDELGNTIITKEVQSLILKLYSPLPANISENSTLWITKLLTNPLIETVVLTEQSDLSCPTIKGPNFDIEVDYVKGKSTAYESLDDLILSASVSSSSNLVAQYLSSSLVNTDDLNIEYHLSGSDNYSWDNFVHFSSAKERVDNFVYKVQLIESYESFISSSLYFSGSSAEIAAGSGSHTGSLSAIQERERQLLKKNQLINNFDGFEKFLYTPSSYSLHNSSSITWPYSGSVRVISSSPLVINNNETGWYNNIIELAESFDIENSNWVQNNIPQYIVNNEENSNFLLFFSMIGHHFDNIYFYTKSLERTRQLGYKSTNGISDRLLFDVLKSFNWDAKNLAADSQLWNYVFGMDSDGNQQYKSFDKQGNLIKSNPAKQRTNEIWRRIVNNLPYLLKHKGTRRGIYAIMACYGVPSSNLSILEFGGPEVGDSSKSKLVYENITTALKMSLTSSVEIEWGQTNTNIVPNTIEFFIKPNESENYTLISGSGWNVSISASANDERSGQVAFNYDTTNVISSSVLPIYNGQFFGISVSSGSNGLKLDVRQSNKEKTIFQESITGSFETNWNNGNSIKLGGNYFGSVDEFRLWSSQLDTQRFFEHVSFPEMINGNSVSGSTDELHFRLDFEYPKNLALTSSLINVDTNIFYPQIQLNPSTSLQLTRNILEETGSINSDAIKSVNTFTVFSASATGFSSIVDYPYNFEVIDRTVVLEIPDLGAGRYSTNKIRFESQTDFAGNNVIGGIDLSLKSRVTKKAFDQSPTDSNRVGLFFSPTKELNIDIAKSIGGINLDNLIGNPGDRTKSTYTSLDNLRHYYFQRFDNRDIYAYINLIKLYEKSMFEDIKKMLPARVKATTGLLIEPHILERSKIAQKDPTGEQYQKEAIIHYSDTTILRGENNQLFSLINVNLSENIFGETNQLEGIIHTASINSIIAENNQLDTSILNNTSPITFAESYQLDVTVDTALDLPTITTEIELNLETIGQTQFETIGFGIYAQSGSAIRTYFDKDNRRVKERIRVQLITEQKERIVTKFAVTASANGLGDPRGGFITDIQTFTETKLNIQPFSGSVVPVVKGNIIEVKNVDGYLPTHYRNTNDLTRGLQNSFFRGCKNTEATTLDGSSPIETFVSNPNTLVVNKTGRNTSEPILEVE